MTAFEKLMAEHPTWPLWTCVQVWNGCAAEAERLCRDPRSYRRPETAAEDLADAIAKLAEVDR